MVARHYPVAFTVVVSCVLAGASVAVAAKPIVPLTGCNQFLEDVIAELTGDLNCSSGPRTAVSLERGVGA